MHNPDVVYLAAGDDELTRSLVSLAWIMAVALAAPLISHALKGKLSSVPVLIILGMVIGPSVLNLAHKDPGIDMLAEIGVGALFLLAGFEIKIEALKSKQARTAFSTWLICLLVSFAGAYVTLDFQSIDLAIVLALAVTSTALGTITPMLKQHGMIGTRVGKSVLIHGAVGEVGPICAMALLLSTRSTWVTALILLGFIGITVLVAVAPRVISVALPFIKDAFIDSAGSTHQTILRLIMLMLGVLMAVAAVFELDIVLGAFATGMILNLIIPKEFHKRLEHRLDVLFYSMLIPLFFVVSGIAIDWNVIAQRPLIVLAIPLLVLVTRGLPVFLRENLHHTGSEIETFPERVQVSLYAATGLPIIVAVMSIAVSSEIVTNEQASLFIAGGALTVATFPLIAGMIPSPSTQPAPDAEDKPAVESAG